FEAIMAPGPRLAHGDGQVAGNPRARSAAGVQRTPDQSAAGNSWPMEATMQRVTGIGGIFFKSPDPKALGAWYRDHLGLDATEWGGAMFQWGGDASPPGMTLWSPFAQDTGYMAPS